MSEINWWHYEQLPSGAPYEWHPASRGDSEFDTTDFHLDIGCGRLKKGRLGIDRHADPGVDLAIDLETLMPSTLVDAEHPTRIRTGHLYEEVGKAMQGPGEHDAVWIAPGLPFPDASIESIVSHHALEHVGNGFLPLMDECYRVLKPGGIFRIIVPLFPSRTAVEDPDHKRYFMEGTFETFGGREGETHWHESFSTPYTNCRFEIIDKDMTAPTPLMEMWGESDAREMRVALRK